MFMFFFFFFSSRRRHTRYWRDWSSDVCSSDLETPLKGELPRVCANRLAYAKATTALAGIGVDDDVYGAFILAADTVVAVGRRILPKPELIDEAAQCLRLLSGRNHPVYTGLCLITPNRRYRQRGVETRGPFKR